MRPDERLSNLKHHCEFLAKVIPAESVDTIELEARYLSAMMGQDIAPHRPTLDALVSEIKSAYLGRSD